MNVYSDKEIELISSFGFFEMIEWSNPISLYKIMVDKAFSLDLKGNNVESLRRCYCSLNQGGEDAIWRGTPEWDELIRL